MKEVAGGVTTHICLCHILRGSDPLDIPATPLDRVEQRPDVAGDVVEKMDFWPRHGKWENQNLRGLIRHPGEMARQSRSPAAKYSKGPMHTSTSWAKMGV